MDASSSYRDVTQLLAQWREGDAAARDSVLQLIEQEMHGIAGAQLRRERPNHTLQATALMNEAYLKILGADRVPWRDRVHLLAAASQIMRHVLVDYGRERRRVKRRGDLVHIALDDNLAASPDRLEEALAIDEALRRLAEIDKRKSEVVEMRYFGGLDVEQTAKALGVAPNTVIRDWSFARAWLRRELREGNSG